MRPEDIGTFVAARLRELREARGYSLRQLAHRCDLTPEMLSRAERSERTPSLETIAKVCAGLQMTVAAFFDSQQVGGMLGRLGPERHQPERQETIPRVVRKPLPEGPESAINPRAQEHFLDAVRSIERGMEALQQPPGQRRRGRP